VTAAEVTPPEAKVLEPTAPKANAVRRFLAIPAGLAGTTGLLLILAISLIGPALAPYNPETSVAPPALGPSAAHLLGTDQLGRDVWSRLLSGGLSVIVLPLIAVSGALIIGCAAGLLSGYLGGWTDRIITRAVDVVLALPPFLLVLVIIAGFGTGESVIVIAVAAVYAPSITRVIRSATQVIRPREFVLVARARGDSLGWITLREIAPNIFPTLLVEIAIRLTFAVMFIASLSFLGLGVQPPDPSWGRMLAESRDYLASNAWLAAVPGLAIVLTVLGFNLVGDWLRDVLDPRLKV
jgi:peptide/nickel transport system permease protein